MTKAKVLTPVEAPAGRDVESYLNTFDVPTKIRNGLKKLGMGWLYEHELVKLCGLNQQQFTAYTKNGQFKEYVVREPQAERDKRVWAGTKQLAAKLRGDMS